MNRFRFLVFACFAALVSWGPVGDDAYAHKPSDSYLRIDANEKLAVEWDIAIKDLDFVIGLDSNGDGQITWREVKLAREAIVDHALARLEIYSAGSVLNLSCTDLKIVDHSDGAYVVLELESPEQIQAEELMIDYRLLFEVDPTHRGLVLMKSGDQQVTRVICVNDPPLEISMADVGMWSTLTHYVREGVWHIWIGYDHILFLVSLLLPAVLMAFSRPEKDQHLRWETESDLYPAFRNVLKIVTVFTIAHSITLWLAVMQWVTLPSWLVESVIAFSIVVAACNNLYPVLPLKGWGFAFIFGLVHGFGFANVLVDLGLSNMALGVSLLGFNIGVELGQLAIVVVVMPVIWLIRDTSLYRYGVFSAGSILIALLAGIWTIERVSDVVILPLG